MRIGVFFLVFLPAIACAQVKDMDSIVVTASLNAEHEKETGRNIISIRGESLQGMPISSIDDILRYVSGIEVQQRGPQGSQADILIRGGTFQQVLILIDGVRLNDPLTGHFNGYIPLHPSEIDRIEVLKGAAASIHGSDAIGGVIHIITKTGSMSEQSQKHHLRAGMETGAMGLWNLHGWWRVRTERSSFSAGLTSNNADGQSLRGTTGYFHNHTASIGYARKFGADWRFSFRSAIDIRDFNAQNFYTTFLSDTANERVQSSWQQFHLVKGGKKIQFHADAAFKKLEDRYQFRPAATPNQNRTNMFVAQTYAVFRTDRKTRITTGLQYIQKSIRSNDRGNHALGHAAAYIVAAHRLNAALHVNESVRLDWDENYGWVLVPQANASWSRSKLTVRSSVGNGIRDADFTERYNNYNKTLVTGGSIGNPALKTERSWTYELGADYRFGTGMKASFGVFRRRQRDLIDWTPTPYVQMPRKENLVSGVTYALATNLSSVVTTGMELDLRYETNLNEAGTERLFFLAGLLVLDSKAADKTPSFYISSHARTLLNGMLQYRTGDFDIAWNILYKVRNGQQASALQSSLSRAYFLCSVRSAYQLKGLRSSVFAQVYNLFNARFSDLLGAQMPGRWLSAGVNIDLGRTP